MDFVCKYCGSKNIKHKQRQTPHAASLICAECNSQAIWSTEVEATDTSASQSTLEHNMREDREDMLNLYVKW